MTSRHIIKISIIFLAFSATSWTLSCLDDKSNAETWWWQQKYPGNVSKSDPKHGYFDSSSTGGKLSIVKGHVDEKDLALYNTIQSINGLSSKYANLLVFNDEPPNQEWVATGAHAKGIVAFDSQSNTGVYIMHSAPKYPTVTNGQINTSLPSNTVTYAQNFFCINLDSKSLNLLIQNFEVTDPVIYYYSGTFKASYSSKTNSAVNTFTLANGDNMFFLSKNPKYKGYLYENIIEPYFKAGMMIESWGRPYEESECPPQYEYMSANVETVTMPNGDSWNSYSDHSKWGVVNGENFNYGCSCDMNRMTSQISRGGSCLCMVNSNFYATLNNLITKVGCPNNNENLPHTIVTSFYSDSSLAGSGENEVEEGETGPEESQTEETSTLNNIEEEERDSSMFLV